VVAASRSLKLAALVAPPFAYAQGVRHSNRSTGPICRFAAVPHSTGSFRPCGTAPRPRNWRF